jgi:type II secretory pathway pseudopilin PulG
MASRERGFTIVEATIAAGLLTVIAVGSAQLFALAIRQNVRAREHLFMTSAASRKVDELIAASSAGTLVASPSDTLDRSIDGFFDTTIEGGAPFVRRWLIAFPIEYAGGAAAIVVRVSRPQSGTTVQISTLSEVGTR